MELWNRLSADIGKLTMGVRLEKDGDAAERNENRKGVYVV
jgi:hypothetical protein